MDYNYYFNTGLLIKGKFKQFLNILVTFYTETCLYYYVMMMLYKLFIKFKSFTIFSISILETRWKLYFFKISFRKEQTPICYFILVLTLLKSNNSFLVSATPGDFLRFENNKHRCCILFTYYYYIAFKEKKTTKIESLWMRTGHGRIPDVIKHNKKYCIKLWQHTVILEQSFTAERFCFFLFL